MEKIALTYNIISNEILKHALSNGQLTMITLTIYKIIDSKKY